MNIYDFINSKAIRNHLKEINYEFAPAESAYIVWQSAYCSMEEKYEAWKYIIDNTLDENIIDSVTKAYRVSLQECYGKELSLHEYLQSYIDKEKRLAELAMTDEENTVFSFETYYGFDWDICEDKRLFTSMKYLMKAIDEKIADMQDFDLKWIFVKKRWLDTEEKHIELKLKPDKSLFSIVGNGNVCAEHERHLEDVFDGMWFKIPTPFKKGDILYRNVEGGARYIGNEIPFTLENICYWDVDEVEDAKTQHAWCNMDMLATGYFITPEARIYWDSRHNYLDLEYYVEEPTGVHRTLKAMSSYMKNEIDMEEMMVAYSIILDEERAKLQKNGMSDRTLELAGVKGKIK